MSIVPLPLSTAAAVNCAISVFWGVAHIFIAVITFAIYSILDDDGDGVTNELEPAKIFTSLVIFNLMKCVPVTSCARVHTCIASFYALVFSAPLRTTIPLVPHAHFFRAKIPTKAITLYMNPHIPL